METDSNGEKELWLNVSAIEPAATGVVTITMEGDGLPMWAPGAHIDVHVPGGYVRQYSLCGQSGDHRHYTIGVLDELESRGGSRYLCNELKVGDTLEIRGPRNNFSLLPADRYLMIAGGIGITPILAMVRALAARGADWQLLYGGRSETSMAFLDELRSFGDRVRVVPQDVYGHLPLVDWLGEPSEGTKIYVCGPEPLLAAVESHAQIWPHGTIELERFAPKPHAPYVDSAFDVELEDSGITVTVPPGTSILEAVESVGVSVLASCREGTCGTCETRILAGMADHRDSLLDDDEKAANEVMMICVSRSKTPSLTLEL